MTFSRMVEVDENNSPLAIEPVIAEDGDNPGKYIVQEPNVDLDWTGEANASDCRALASSLIEAADVLDTIGAELSA